MPSPACDAPIGFATPKWFERLPISVPQHLPDRPHLVVEHQAIPCDGNTVVHQQIFGEHDLAAWLPGRVVANPHLILTRPSDSDIADLLGPASATETITATSITVGQHHPTCPLGITGTHRPGLAQAAVETPEVDVLLEILATPFGDAEIAIRLFPGGHQAVITPPEADTDISLRLQWPALTEWLHSDTSLGNLFARRDIEIDGHFAKLSYIEGHISWPPTLKHRQRSSDFRRIMDCYQEQRQSPAYLDLMDQIEELAP